MLIELVHLGTDRQIEIVVADRLQQLAGTPATACRRGGLYAAAMTRLRMARFGAGDAEIGKDEDAQLGRQARPMPAAIDQRRELMRRDIFAATDFRQAKLPYFGDS